jgi:hypothetical protein
MRAAVLVILLSSVSVLADDRKIEVVSSPPNVICAVPDGSLGAIGNLCMLRAQLEQMKGVTVRLNGIDQTEALKMITDAIFDIERRLEAIEAKK